MNSNLPFIPESITVHLGAPDTNAENVTIPFLDYIANVASSEIYPTWNENALRANILAEISFALNRFYTEYYRSRGYSFDITNSTSADQSFVNERAIFGNIYDLCAELFNSYITRVGNVEPLFAAYCDGIETTCEGMSQWGSQELAESGKNVFEILEYYYGDVEVVSNVPIGGSVIPAPTFPIRLGQTGDSVRTVQIRLNRVSNNYPLIPKIAEIDGNFTYDTENAVKAFQTSFSLEADGIVGPTTWYTLQKIYFSVKKLNEINSEGITLDEVTQQFPSNLSLGSEGIGISNLQFYINYLSAYYRTIPSVEITGVFDGQTQTAVIDVQNTFGLEPDGIVGRLTWEAIYNIYLGIIATVPKEFTEGQTIPFPGVVLRIGSESEDVRIYQEYLSYISKYYDEIPSVNVTGYFGNLTREATMALQELVGIPVTGTVGVLTWNAATELYTDLYSANTPSEGQYPGYEIGGAS